MKKTDLLINISAILFAMFCVYKSVKGLVTGSYHPYEWIMSAVFFILLCCDIILLIHATKLRKNEREFESALKELQEFITETKKIMEEDVSEYTDSRANNES